MTEKRAIERVVVPLDAASDSRAAIDTAVELAARVKATLRGIFVEDEDLLHLASLPFARQSTLGAGVERLTRDAIELHLKAAAERARRQLLAAAGRRGVDATFEIIRGAAESALAAASEGDLMIAGGDTRPIGRHFRLECRWWASVEAAAGPLLLVRHARSKLGSVVMLLYNRSPASARLLLAAAQVALATDRMLTVICPPPAAGRGGFERWIAERLAGSPVRLQVEAAPPGSSELRARIGELGCDTLAVAGGEEASGGEASGRRLREYVERFACDILTAR